MTPIIPNTERQSAFLKELQQDLRTQDECFTKTPLYCVYERENESDPKEGNGWPTSMFLTHEAAHQFMTAVHYRLNHPYIYVRSPGEDSDLHPLHCILKEMECGNGPFVDED